jgi:hypothetical protein
MASTAGHRRGVGIGVFVVHVFVVGSYISSVATSMSGIRPPTTYNFPPMTADPPALRAWCMGALVVHVSVAGS